MYSVIISSEKMIAMIAELRDLAAEARRDVLRRPSLPPGRSFVEQRSSAWSARRRLSFFRRIWKLL